MRHEPLPDDLAPVFGVDEARARGLGATRLRASDLTMPVRRLRQRTDAETMSAETRLTSLAKAFAEESTEHIFFSHITAAVLWGLPLPRGVIGPDLDVAVWAPRRNPRGRGIRGHEVGARLAEVVRHPEHGIPVATPATTWAMLGRRLRDPYDLVAAGDAVVRSPQHPDDPPALAGVDDLARAVDAGRRVGVRALRAALPDIRDGASSRPETHTRLVIVNAGLPEPTLAHDVFDRDGDWIGRVDMTYPRWRIAVEYEGEQHLYDPSQWARDIRRYERLVADGWLVIRVTKDDLARPMVLAGRVRRAIALRAG